MEERARYSSHWDGAQGILFTRITGLIGTKEVEAWEKSLLAEGEKIPAGSRFRFLVDESGYEPENDSVHTLKKAVMPRFLARFGFILSLLPEDEAAALKQETPVNDNDIRCIAVAMNHHDAGKMQKIQDEFGQLNEHYFSCYQDALAWIKNYP